MEFDAIQERARADLIIPIAHGEADIYLWEHSVRVASNCLCIAQFPEVSSRSPDLRALYAAGLYHDSAWGRRCRNGEIQRWEILAGSTPEADLDISAALMRKSLSEILPESTLDCAAAAIVSRNDRALATLEGQTLSDADGLEEFGLVSLWTIVRRGALEGKGIQAAIDTWKRKKEYQFWTARLADSFRFDSARKLARWKLERFEQFMRELSEELSLEVVPPLSNPRPASETA